MIDLRLLKNYSDFKKVKSGEVFIKDGDTMGDQMYIILAGKAGVYKNYGHASEVKISELNPGEFFGEMTLFLHRNRTADIVALNDLTVLEINRDNAYHFFEKSPAATYFLIQSLCERIESLNNGYLELHAQLYPELHEKPAEPVDTPAKAADTHEQAKAPAAATGQPKATAKIGPSSLFPEGHQSYVLKDAEPDQSLFFNKIFTCPMCENKFPFPSVRTTKLRAVTTDNDLRVNYDGINVTHYLALTCPQCLFSAITTEFEKAMASRMGMVLKAVEGYKNELHADFNAVDADTIFTRLYLALACMPLCYSNHILHTARLWLNISWLYRDCGDENMEKYALDKALQAYAQAYSAINLDKKNEQRVCIIIGELSFKLGDMAKAREYYYLAKVNKEGVRQLSEMADDRLGDIKRQVGQQQG